ncbi:predicted protein [Naegleria gruberi]|uniref:Predicted protein n=1 Tax=Naegleria gruberi TaxID=5762 RepID=D2VLR0_NAEGR|nr:uncharacterized protein NAEGRDRAFT_69868 [Naegleria gruberi]EFC42102.1 predicted protein [Naegleria gruberi]|eukprot:XP_002674846.1 predicted protein [Naegleria gruberi strain NEG-M]
MKQFIITLCLCLLCSLLIIGMSTAQQNDDRSEYSRPIRQVRRIRREKLINQVETLLKELKKLHLEEELADSMNLPNAECLRCLMKKNDDLKDSVKSSVGFVGGSMRCLEVCTAAN